MEEWKEYRLGEVVAMKNGKKRPTEEGLYPVYGGNGIMGYVSSYNSENTIIIGRVGAYCGNVYYCKGKCWVSDNAISVKTNDGFNFVFLFYLMQTLNLHNQHIGGAQPLMTQDIIGNFNIRVPSLRIQDKIALTLSLFDDKIVLNQKINSNLEEQAKALFKSWFIDFEPFKDGKFVDSELGKIPEGWKMVQFETFISESQDKVKVGTYPAYSVTNNGITPRIEKFKKQLSKATSKEKILRKDDLVFGMSRQILNWGIMQDEIGGVSSAYHVYKIDKERVVPTYLRYFIKGYQTYFRDLIGTAAREGQSLDKGALMNKKLFVPSEDILQAFIQHITTLENAVRLFKRQCYRLSSLRDSLLPRLMSGEIEVRL